MDISTVLDIITTAFKIPDAPLSPLPPPLIYSGGQLRPGLSVRNIAARIISRQSEAGAPVGVLPDGSKNIAEAMEVIRIEEIINALLTEGKVEVVIPPGVQVSTVGIGNLGAPVISQGATTNFGIGQGIIR